MIYAVISIYHEHRFSLDVYTTDGNITPNDEKIYEHYTDKWHEIEGMLVFYQVNRVFYNGVTEWDMHHRLFKVFNSELLHNLSEYSPVDALLIHRLFIERYPDRKDLSAALDLWKVADTPSMIVFDTMVKFMDIPARQTGYASEEAYLADMLEFLNSKFVTIKFVYSGEQAPSLHIVKIEEK